MGRPMVGKTFLLGGFLGQFLPAAKEPRVVTVKPEREPGVLINPGCGWQKLCHGRPQGEIEKMPMVSTYYWRTSWTRYEPSRENYRNSPAVRIIDAWLKYASENGRYVAIRVVPYNSRNPGYQRAAAQKVQGCDSIVPAYIYNVLAAKGFPEPGDSGGWVPVFWDPVYLEQHEKLARFLGRRYNGHPNLAYVDVPAGNYGEMNLRNTGVKELDDLSKWKEFGLTADVWDGMIRKMVDFYREAFPDTMLIAARDYISYGKGQQTPEYAISKGVGFRDDGLGMAYCRAGRTNRPYERYWKQVPCLYENGYVDWVDWQNYGTDARACVEWAVDQTHACIVMVGKGTGAERSYSQYESIVEEVGRRLGSRLRVKAAQYVTPTRSRGRFSVGLVWTNSGNTPVYRDLDLEVALMRGPAYAARQVIPAKVARVRTWMPGQDVPMTVEFDLKGLPAGPYEIRVSFYPPGRETDRRFRYKPAMKDRDDFQRALVGVVELAATVRDLTRAAHGAPAEGTPAEAASPAAEAVRRLFRSHEYENAAREAGALAGASEGAEKELAEWLKRAADAALRMREWLIERPEKAGGQTVYVELFGRKMRGRVASVEEAGIVAGVSGSEVPVRWTELSEVRLYRLARACAPEGAEAHLVLATFCAEAGLADEAREAREKLGSTPRKDRAAEIARRIR